MNAASRAMAMVRAGQRRSAARRHGAGASMRIGAQRVPGRLVEHQLLGQRVEHARRCRPLRPAAPGRDGARAASCPGAAGCRTGECRAATPPPSPHGRRWRRGWRSRPPSPPGRSRAGPAPGRRRSAPSRRRRSPPSPARRIARARSAEDGVPSYRPITPSIRITSASLRRLRQQARQRSRPTIHRSSDCDRRAAGAFEHHRVDEIGAAFEHAHALALARPACAPAPPSRWSCPGRTPRRRSARA